MIVTKKKMILRTDRISGIICSILFVTYVVLSLFIKASSTNYTIAIQQAQYEIEEIKEMNNNLNIEIQVLQNKDRVYTIAQESGLTQNQDNVVAIN